MRSRLDRRFNSEEQKPIPGATEVRGAEDQRGGDITYPNVLLSLFVPSILLDYL